MTYNDEMKKGKNGNGHMNWQGHGHSEFRAGFWKQPVKRGSVLFMTDVIVFCVAVLRIVTNHVFIYIYIYVEKPLNECVDTFLF